MGEFLKFSPSRGREKGVLSLYVLNSLASSPKSGYELIREIEEKTGGKWIPSKGSVYPLLGQLEGDGLVRVKKIDKRNKKVFEATSKGKRFLKKIRGRDFEDRVFVLKNLILEIFGRKNSVDSLVFEIAESVKGKKDVSRIERILKKALFEIKKIE